MYIYFWIYENGAKELKLHPKWAFISRQKPEISKGDDFSWTALFDLLKNSDPPTPLPPPLLYDWLLTVKDIFCSSAMDEKLLADAIRMTNIAVNLCLSNKFFQAQAKLEPW